MYTEPYHSKKFVHAYAFTVGATQSLRSCLVGMPALFHAALVAGGCAALVFAVTYQRRHRKSYIFFYGSCISSESRARTGLTGRCLPCTVTGFKRTWSASVDLRAHNIVSNEAILGVTAVSVQPSAPTTRCNGVIVEVPSSELPRFDEREAGYERNPLAREAVVVLASEAGGEEALPADAACWIYVHPPGTPTAAAPVLQTYLDVMLLGCTEYGSSFAEEFVSTTTGWGDVPGAYIDDREAPGYVRASAAAAKKAALWDAMLLKLAPQALMSRVKGPSAP